MVIGTLTHSYLVPLALTAIALLPASESLRTFESDPAGKPPAGFTFHVARQPSTPRWLVEREATNSFLVHRGTPAEQSGFALALVENDRRRDVTLSTRVRLSAGRRSGGLVWRVQDADNYYLVRLDLDRQDIGLYRVAGGNRTRIDYEDDLELDPSGWHTLRVIQQDEEMRVYLGGIRVLRARDRTFSQPGSLGVWCEGDAVAHYDDLKFATPEDKDRSDRDNAHSRR